MASGATEWFPQPLNQKNKNEATHHTAFQTILLLLHLLSHDPLCLRSHIALGFTRQCQGVSVFPGESGTSGRERGPVAPAGRAEQGFYSGADSSMINSNYGSELFFPCLSYLVEIADKTDEVM